MQWDNSSAARSSPYRRHPTGVTKQPRFIARPSLLSNFENLRPQQLAGFRNLVYVIGVGVPFPDISHGDSMGGRAHSLSFFLAFFLLMLLFLCR